MRFFISVFVLSSFLYAQTPYKTGQELYIQNGCYGCHGNEAQGMNNYPRLANRAKGFLTYKLKRFRDKISDNQQQELMISFALKLSDEDIDNLTTYLSEFIEPKRDQQYDYSYKTWGDGGS